MLQAERVTYPPTVVLLASLLSELLGRDEPTQLYVYSDPHLIGAYAIRVPEWKGNGTDFIIDTNAKLESRVTPVVFSSWPPTTLGGKPCSNG